jgi:hypothetical protein
VAGRGVTGWLVLSPERVGEVAAEWRSLRARERPTLLPVEDRPPPVVRVSDGPVRQVEMAEVAA